MLLAVLEHHLNGPPLGVNSPRVKEAQARVGGQQPITLPVSRASDKEDSDRHSAEDRVVDHVVALVAPAVPHALLSLLDHRRGCECAPVHVVFCPAVLTHLDHAQKVAFDAAAVDKPDQLLAREPAVRQQIREPDTFLYGSLDHFDGQFYLAFVIFRLPLAVAFGAVPAWLPALAKLLVAHAVCPLLVFLAEQGEVQHQDQPKNPPQRPPLPLEREVI